MKFAVALCVCMSVALTVARPGENKYTDRYDNVDVKEIVTNDRLRQPYLDCILDVGKCAPDAKELKSRILEALQSGCAKCTDKQKEGTNIVIKYLINHKPEDWDKLTAKYDPKKEYTVKYEKELREIKA